jgi:hypothetical protein
MMTGSVTLYVLNNEFGCVERARAAPESFESMNEGPTLFERLLDTVCDAWSSVSAISIPPALWRVRQKKCW